MCVCTYPHPNYWTDVLIDIKMPLPGFTLRRRGMLRHTHQITLTRNIIATNLFAVFLCLFICFFFFLFFFFVYYSLLRLISIESMFNVPWNRTDINTKQKLDSNTYCLICVQLLCILINVYMTHPFFGYIMWCRFLPFLVLLWFTDRTHTI